MNLPIISKPTGLAIACADIVGAKKGGSNSRTPVETPDSLHSMAVARIIDLVSEGEIRGLVAGNQSVYLDQVPVQNADGTLNFSGVSIETRSGTQDQEHIAGSPSVENEVAVNVELRSDQPVVRTVSGADLSAVRVRFGVPMLQRANTENGDTEGYSIAYAIDIATDGGAFSTVLSNAFSGKTTTQYERSHRIELPAGRQWQVRIRRLTANANSSSIADTVNVLSLTELIDAKLRYPNSALCAVAVDASQFQSIPARSYQIWGRIVRVPSNYDPATRAYLGIWDGTFKSAWTNNPAWVFFDIVTNDRLGLGHRIPLDWVNKWRLYQIAQYCDQLVSDGLGGQEPRFTCSLYLQTRADAYRVLQDIASMFRGISFYAGGQVLASADMPKDPVYTYSQANVLEGRFNYEGSARRARHTVALVSWTDPDDFGRQKVEVVQHFEGIARYGINQTEVTAVGCHSRAQAQRVGNHILFTENMETETVSFAVGLDALHCGPGDIIQVADPGRAGRRNAGRIRVATASSLELDRVPESLQVGDTLRATLPSGRTEGRTVRSVAGNVVTVAAPWSALPVAQSVWAVESAELALQQFRVLSVRERDINAEDGITYEIVALKHEPGKFAAIDDGTRLEPLPISIVPPSVQPPPKNVALSSHVVVDQGIATPVLTIAWDASDKAIAYDVEWRRDDLNWVRAGRVATQSLEVRGVYAGQYLARVRAVNALNAVSQPALSALTHIQGKTTPPPALTSLTTSSLVFGIGLQWGFPPGATDTQRTELWYSAGPDRATAIKLGDFAYPQARHQINGLAAGARFYFWGRLVDRSGNIGPWFPAGVGVVGQSSVDQTEYDAYFAGKINESALGQELLTKVETIDSLEPLLPVLWDPNAVYDRGRTVVLAGRTYVWRAPAPGNDRPPSASWQDVGAGMAGYGALVSQVDQNTQNIVEVDGKVRAQAQQINGISAQLDASGAAEGDWGAASTDVFAGSMTIQSVIASNDLVQAMRTDQVQVKLGETAAAVQSEAVARATAQEALARRQDTTDANLAGTRASVQQVSQSLVTLEGKVGATYTVRAQITSAGQIYMAGMGVGVEQQPDGSYQSQILFQADRLALINVVNGQVTAPFVIQGGQTFISQALIGTGWITNAHIANAAITNGKISGVLQSDDYVAGQRGWRIDKAGGGFEVNGITPDGYRTRVTNNGVYVYYANGVPAVELGVLL